MKPDKKALWVEALRSGDYQQGQYNLRVGDRYCCLGVLCDLYAKEHAQDENKQWDIHSREDSVYEFLAETELLPVDVQKWAGIQDPSGHIMRGQVIIGGSYSSLSGLNDDEGMTFEELADVIEAKL